MLKKALQVQKFSESRIHDWLQHRFSEGKGVEIGIGHDVAAVITAKKSFLKVDQVIEGVHFSKSTLPRLVGRKALCRALSDAAAAGGRPRYFLTALAVPSRWKLANLQEFFLGLREAGNLYGISLVGGDLARTSGPFVASISLLGEFSGTKPPGRRDRARPGQVIVVSGRLGGSILGKHLSFKPRIREGIRLRTQYRLGAVMDLSDGLAIDLRRLCDASGIGAVLDASAIPISPAAKLLAKRTGRSPRWHACNDGEDYELLWTAEPSQVRRMLRDPLLRACGVTPIGMIRKQRGLFWRLPSGKVEPFPKGGYEHVWR